MAEQGILASYSPEDITIVISNDNFSHTIGGYTDGSFVTLTRVVPHATLYTGAKSDNVRVVRDVKNFDVTLTLHNAASSNDILSRLLQLDAISRDGRDTFAITIKDNIGRTVGSAPAAFIGTDPDVEYATDVTDREWVLHAVGMELHIGGNAKLAPENWDTMADLGATPSDFWRYN